MPLHFSNQDAPQAPHFLIPTQRIITVEHPCFVKNVDGAIEMLGGGRPLSETLDHASKTTLPLRFKSDGQSIMSMNNEVNSILLKISVPKRSGKRKRGSNEPFRSIEAEESTYNAQDLLRSISDKPEQVQLTPLGMIENSHIFRTLPDFVYSTSSSRFKSEINQKLIGQDLKNIKTFQLPESYGLQNTEMFPPPILSTFSLPQTYSYLDKQSSKAKAAPQPDNPSVSIPIVNDLDNSWPTAAPHIPLRSEPVQAVLQALQELFTRRPILSLQAVTRNLPNGADQSHVVRALPYIAFQVISGPWAGTFCRYGVDPRTSPEFAIYQTIDSPSEDGLHDGTPRHQLTDIKDPPQLAAIITSHSTPLRTVCEPVYHGWYHSGTLAKLRTLFRAGRLATGGAPTAEEYEALLALPDRTASSEAAGFSQTTRTESGRLLFDDYCRYLRESEEAVRKRREISSGT